MRIASLLLIACIAAGLGCTHPMATPSEIARSQNDIDWRIEREPQVGKPPAQPPPATP